MAMKKIKPQYGKVVPPVTAEENSTKKKTATAPSEPLPANETPTTTAEQTNEANEVAPPEKISAPAETQPKKTETKAEAKKSSSSAMTSEPNPFLQTKDVFAKAQLTKIGYRMRTEYVEVLDIIKKIKKGGYTLEAVLDDALTFYFENSEDGKDAVKKAELFYS